MSFTTEIKQEIANNKMKKCCAKAELSALIHLTSSISISNRKLGLLIRTENPTTAKRTVQLLKNLYGININLAVARKSNLKKNKIYRINVTEKVKEILTDLGIYGKKGLASTPNSKIVKNLCCQKAYLTGAFLAYGTCNSPSSNNYHFEISASDYSLANFIKKLFEKHNIDSKVSKRRNRYVVYIKKAEKIEDALKLIGSSDCLISFVNNRVTRDLKTNIIRVDNCTMANIAKSLKAAEVQMKKIKKIKKANKENGLDIKLKEVYDLRLNNPESSLLELCDEYERIYGMEISKSGIKHRLNKIEEYADSL